MSGNNFWGSTIASIRLEQGISQRMLADRTKVNRSTLRRIEAGLTPGNMDFIEKVLNYLGYELEVLASASVVERAKMQARIETDPARKAKLAADRIMALSYLK